ncbi:metallophosphoesterase family protein [Fulvivirga sp. M361]|uniref:purple acid phosphatase family protein n=1 Tax=Fulvivirga sp. M361 TaxID=2594266 RepID=UPI00117BB0D5|nr:metallophosphoesterase family protein [Fulvivirga sp. M361]TRX51181.1 metallophosphoesterase family protein [Fulvivirga sp. M361]
MKNTCICLLVLLSTNLLAQLPEKNLPPRHPQFDFHPSQRPDRLLLTWTDNSSSTQTVTWRTDTTITKGYAEITLADPSPDFHKEATQFIAETQLMITDFGKAAYHTVNFTELKPNTTYAYRVGADKYWSEWVQFVTAGTDFEPYSFIYLGDAQNKLYSHWSRAIQAAYREAPKSKFIVHAGDLINHSQNDYEWGEWFEAAGAAVKMIPTITIPGNHEYIKNPEGKKVSLTPFWDPQFNFPQNGPKGLEDQCYYIDVQNVRIISLNSNDDFKIQANWLSETLSNNPNQWTFVTFHHPVVSAAKGRVNEQVLKLWKPILDKHKVDMVLQGHDHTYARAQNLTTGTNSYEGSSGTVYVVSVSGPKMYPLTEQPWMERSAENTQLYQIIDVANDHLIYRSFTTGGMLYDAFRIEKRAEASNELIELPTDYQVERRFRNTLTDRDDE